MCDTIYEVRFHSLFSKPKEKYAEKSYLHPFEVNHQWQSIKESLMEVRIFFHSFDALKIEETAQHTVSRPPLSFGLYMILYMTLIFCIWTVYDTDRQYAPVSNWLHFRYFDFLHPDCVNFRWCRRCSRFAAWAMRLQHRRIACYVIWPDEE